jgi:hypothetical protein
MLVLTTLLAIVVGGLTWQRRLVLQRQATLQWIQVNGGGVVDAISGATVDSARYEQQVALRELGRVRVLLGDRRYLFLYLPDNCAPWRNRVAEIFPEAQISVVADEWQYVNDQDILSNYHWKTSLFEPGGSLE